MEKFVKRVAAVPVLALAFALALPVIASAQDLVPIGETVGIEAVTDGLLVASLSKVETPEGEVCPAADGGIFCRTHPFADSDTGSGLPFRVRRK